MLNIEWKNNERFRRFNFILHENVMCQEKVKREDKFFWFTCFNIFFTPKHRLVVILLFSSLKACIFKQRSCFMISIVLTTTKVISTSFSYVKCARPLNINEGLNYCGDQRSCFLNQLRCFLKPFKHTFERSESHVIVFVMFQKLKSMYKQKVQKENLCCRGLFLTSWDQKGN